MKKITLVVLFSLLAFVLCSCQSSLSFPKSPFKKQSFIKVSDLDPDAKMALTVLEAAKFKYLQSFPYARISSDTQFNLKTQTDYFKFKQTNMVVIENTNEPDASLRKLVVVCESVDKNGRRDISKNSITYKMTEPDKKEKAAIAKNIMQSAKKTRRLKNSGVKENINNSVMEYQKAKNLSADGLIGKNTINTMLNDIRIVDVKTLEILPLYTKNPRFEAYILWSDVVAKHPGKYTKGLKSINNVRKKALSLEDLKNMSEVSNDFVVFVYFFDRINPTYPVRCGLSATQRGTAKIKGSYLYADPHLWPVLAQSLKIDSKIDSDELYVNIYRNSKPMGDALLSCQKIN